MTIEIREGRGYGPEKDHVFLQVTALLYLIVARKQFRGFTMELRIVALTSTLYETGNCLICNAILDRVIRMEQATA